MVYRRFCSILFTLRHSLKPVFPCVPHLSVAVYVVRRIDTPEEAPYKHNEALCNMLDFHLCISLFIPIDFRLLFRYCVTCETYAKYKNQAEMQMTNTKKRITAALTAAILATTLTIPATAAETPTIRVSSYKGSTLEVGERSGLIIGPSGTEYTVTSNAPDTIAAEQVLTFWVAVAKAEGSAEITAFNSAGGARERNTARRPRCPRRIGIPRQRGQRWPDRQHGDTAGDDPPHQPDQKGQWSVRVAGQ